MRLIALFCLQSREKERLIQWITPSDWDSSAITWKKSVWTWTWKFVFKKVSKIPVLKMPILMLELNETTMCVKLAKKPLNSSEWNN